ncbi:MAG: hypothetical protein ACRC0V_11685 [Fusobacteriaceae bacterium]|uniref:hypothetical protein n=1 Tax=Cetobacterium sp. TaxID=2071632 RepID=UPI003F3FD7B1
MFKKLALIIFGCSLLVYSFLQFQKSFLKVENVGYNQFIAGNKLVKENKHEDALKEYSEAMNVNEDINIKKNYEIAFKKLQEKQKESKESSENNKDSDDKNKKNEENQNGNNEQNESEKNENSENKESNNSSEAGESDKEKQKEDELKSIMQRLESNEKKAFKNNEKMLNNSENKDSENRW